MHQVSKRSLAALGVVLCLALPPALACSSTPQNVVCGVGTKQVNGACVPDVGGEAGASDGGLNVSDAAEVPDVDTFDAGPDEPCPVITPEYVQTQADKGSYFSLAKKHIIINCDAKCGDVSFWCQRAHCLPSGRRRTPSEVQRYGGEALEDNVTVRLPRDPWTLWGECDPDTSKRYPERPDRPLRPYTAMALQPKSSFFFEARRTVEDKEFRIEAGPWTVRVFNNFRHYEDALPAFPQLFENPESVRSEPLFDVRDAFSPFEHDRSGCTKFNASHFQLQQPSGVAPAFNSGRPTYGFYTKQPHIAATNIIISVNTTCGASL
jgi:hypothetical protein